MSCDAITSRLLVGLVVCGATLVASAQPAEWKPASVTVRDGMLRVEASGVGPLASALSELERLCMCPITFEYPPVEHPDDVVEMSKRRVDGGSRGLIPKPGTFTFSHALRGSDVREEIEDVVREAIRAYEKQGLPGEFKVDQEGTMLHVTPTYVRSKAGGIKSVGSVLDARITLSEREWPAIEGISAILDGVREVSEVSVKLTVQPINLLGRHRVRVAADNEPAHTVLARLLETYPAPMSWTVGYDILARQYIVAIHLVRPR